VTAGFETFVYSRSPAPNVKAALSQAIGAKYVSSEETPVDELAAEVGNIDLVYEAIGVSRLSYEVLRVLGMNGIFVFTGIPAPSPPSAVEADAIMRNVVLKNQVIVGTVNADRPAFEAAISDLGVFRSRWPDALRAMITGRYPMDSYRDLLLGKANGIKNVITLT
jgi:glucose 1-dehydrogenase